MQIQCSIQTSSLMETPNKYQDSEKKRKLSSEDLKLISGSNI